ncbi:QRFP-like peptide receptor [Lamellibrachia satsuma]|nr:QRFP-like peptide receptor [Lamellibrachia satsuma]
MWGHLTSDGSFAPGCPRVVEYVLWSTCRGVRVVEYVLWSTCCGILAVEHVLWSTCCGIRVVEYYAICHPLRARHVHTIRRAAIILMTLWVASFVIVSPQLVIQRLEPVLVFQPHMDPPIRMAQVCAEYFHDARLSTAYTMVIYFVLYLAPVATMFVTYGKIAHTLWIRGPIGETTDNQRENKRRLLEKQRIVRMLIVIVVVFAVSWFPFFTCQVYLLFYEHTSRMRILAAFLHLLGYSNACVNPALYCFLNDSFQQHFFRTLCCQCFWQRRKRHLADRHSERNGTNSHATMTSLIPSHNSVLQTTV